MNASILFIATLVIVGLLVTVLVIYLILIIVALRRAGNQLQTLAGGLQKIVDDSSPLAGKVGTINSALIKLQEGLSSVDNHLINVAKVLKLV
tara:strand:- start:12480 stop:12755 length:276 start_codon:yes stop_codon:yes gene_type:complete